MDFVAIDFETANHRPDSACQVAAVVVEQSRIVSERDWLIRPPSNYFAPINISIHGIRPEDVLDAPAMDAVWAELSDMVVGRTVIAHNARFDMAVLVASLASYDIACPNIEFQCTRSLARAAWPQRHRYGLKPLAEWLGISFQHHDALEDARCCALVAIAVESQLGPIEPLDSLERRLRIARGHYRNDQLTSPRRLRSMGLGTATNSVARQTGGSSSAVRQPAGSVCVETIRQSSDGQPLEGKYIVMLGALRGLSMAETQELLQELGAEVQSSIDERTHFVVSSGMALSQARQMFTEQTQGIKLLSERQFRALLPGGSVERF